MRSRRPTTGRRAHKPSRQCVSSRRVRASQDAADVRLRSSTVRRLRSAGVSLPRIVIGSSTFSNADRFASKLNVWNTKPVYVPSTCVSAHAKHTHKCAELNVRGVDRTDAAKAQVGEVGVAGALVDDLAENLQTA